MVDHIVSMYDMTVWFSSTIGRDNNSTNVNAVKNIVLKSQISNSTWYTLALI